MDPDVRVAVALSHLRAVPEDVLEALLSGAQRLAVPRGTVTHREGDRAPHLELVVAGALRLYVAAPDGRTMTIRYCRSGDLIGVMSLFSSAFVMPGSTQALADAEIVQLSPSVAMRMSRDHRVSTAFLAELSDRGQQFAREIPGSVFATVRERVARHLLDLASEAVREPVADGVERPVLRVEVTQQQVAEAVGSVREVVVRSIRELRKQGVLCTERGGIVIVDPERLVGEVWNPGP